MNAPPDGYTLAVVSTSAAVSSSFYQHLNFNLIRDSVPVSGIVRVPLVMVVHPSVPATTVPEFIVYRAPFGPAIVVTQDPSRTSTSIFAVMHKRPSCRGGDQRQNVHLTYNYCGLVAQYGFNLTLSIYMRDSATGLRAEFPPLEDVERQRPRFHWGR